jgi:hypothetical protein
MNKKLVELALLEGKKRLSKQTGYIHLFIEDPTFSSQDSIPILENFLYAYSLMRSRLAQNIQEGKDLLENLLHFEKDGNFPVYLHEYPVCRDNQFSSQLLPVFFYLLKDFKSGMGEMLTRRIQMLTERIKKTLCKEPLSVLSQNRLDAFQGNFKEESWMPSSSAEWGEFCICSQMSGLSLEKATEFWDSKRHVFIGKGKDRLQEESEPAITLFDLFMGDVFDSLSARALKGHSIHLRASLIQPCAKMKKENGSYSAIIDESGRQSFTLYSGDAKITNSLVIEAKKGTFKVLDKGNGKYEILYSYDEELPSEMDSTELNFYIDDKQTVFIGREKATAFQAGDTLEIHSPYLQVSAVIETDPSQGQWMGHISKGNRSFQKSKAPHAAYDWKIGWRTLRRESKALAKISIEIKPCLLDKKDCQQLAP